MNMQEILFETERTHVRYFTICDFDDLHEILSDTATMEFMEAPLNAYETREFLEEFCVKEKRALAVVYKGDSKVIGYILLSDKIQKDVYEIGWIFNKKYWNKGLAFEAVSATINYAFTYLNAYKVFAETIDDVKSVRLMGKLGMSCEGIQRKQVRDNKGVWKDMYFYGILCEEYKSTNMKKGKKQ